MYLRMIARKIGIEMPINDTEQARVVDPAAVPLGGDEPQRHAEHNGEDHRRERQLERGGEALLELLDDRPAARLRDAEVAADRRPDIAQVLLRQRVVEPVLLVDRLDLLLRGALPEQRRRRAAREGP